MKYRYPRLCNWLIFQNEGNGRYRIFDTLKEKAFWCDARTAWFIQQLNGRRNPYQVSQFFSAREVHSVLGFLDKYKLIRHSRVLEKHWGSIHYSLWIPRVTETAQKAARIFNKLLLWFSFPVLGLGLFLYTKYASEVVCLNLAGIVTGALIGIIAHELAHAAAALAYGGRVFELGVAAYFFLPGAYTMLDSAPVKKRMQNVQIDAAGVEANALLAGMFFLFALAVPLAADFFFMAALYNMLVGFANILLIDGLDGMHIMEKLLGIDNLSAAASNVVLHRKKRKRLARHSMDGQIMLCLYWLIVLLKMISPALFLLNVGGIFLWFM